jgi:hypothetical protein
MQKSKFNFQSCDLLEEICTTILHSKYMQMRQCLGDLILHSSLENRISSLYIKEGLHNKLDKSTQKLKPSKQNTQQKLGFNNSSNSKGITLHNYKK